jgi:hypothetical protein
MKTYRVEAQYITYVYVDIEAEDDDQAWEIARDMDGGDFKDSGFGDWDITNIEEVKPCTT